MLIVLSLPGAMDTGERLWPSSSIASEISPNSGGCLLRGGVWFGLRGIGMLVYLSMRHQMRLECSQAEPVVRGKRTSGHTELHRKAQISTPWRKYIQVVFL